MNQKVDQFPHSGSMIFTPPAHFYFSSPHTPLPNSLPSPPHTKKEPLEVLPPRVHTGVGARHALFPSDWLFGAWTNLSIHPAFSFGCQFPDAIHRPRFTARAKFRPHSRAATTIPDRDLLSEASLPGSVRTCRYGRATHGVDPPTRITL